MRSSAAAEHNRAPTLTFGKASHPGHGHANQDAVAAGWNAAGDVLAAALADGIASSEVSGEAAIAAVDGFVVDYHCAPAAWSAEVAGRHVLTALNAGLHARTLDSRYRQDMNRGYVCACSALVAAGSDANLFQVGDTQIFRRRGGALEACMPTHRVAGDDATHLARALGAGAELEVDHRRIRLQAGDVLLLASDGAHEAWHEAEVIAALDAHGDDAQNAAEAIVAAARARDDRDDASVIVICVQGVTGPAPTERVGPDTPARIPEPLAPRSDFEGLSIVRELSVSARSRVYLAHPRGAPDALCVVKTPGPDVAADKAALERFLLEAWVGGRIDNPHVLKAWPVQASSDAVYGVFEYINGQGLDRWHADHPRAELAAVRDIVSQVGRGLLAFHRRHMLHQDLRPANVLLDATGTARIIDFGAVRIHGVGAAWPAGGVPGTEQFAAPEYFSGEAASPAADQYSLAALTYFLLTGDLPYGPNVSRATTRAAQSRLRYRPVTERRPDVPRWVDAVIRCGVHVDPARRYADVACFIDALTHAPFERDTRDFVPWAERDPVRLWQTVSAVLALGVVALGLYIGLTR